jgi:D-tyrosyl-tRNA(Tyr) deacylase
MRAVIQRVSRAKVSVDSKTIGEIKKGFLVLLGVHCDDAEEKVIKLADKIEKLRIFEDAEGKMNLALKEVGGQILVVSQFTLYGDTTGNNRPSFIEAARPEKALPFYEKLVKLLADKGFRVETGKFGAYMELDFVNDGPTTIIIEL